MGHGTMRARSRVDIELVEHPGYRYRRYIDALGPGFVDEGGDARVTLESPLRLPAIHAARIAVAVVAMGYTQQLM